MGFERTYWHLAWRLGVLLCLTVAISQLLERTHLYATSAVAILVAAALSVDLLRRVDPPSVSLPRPLPSNTPLEYLQALLDTVSAALIVVKEGDRATLVNRAAQRLSRGAISRLSDIASLGTEGAARITSLRPGQSDLLRLIDSRHVFVTCAEIRTSRHLHRLVAMQFVTGDLDAVEVKAWRDMLRVLRHEIMNSLTPIASLSEGLAAAPPGSDTRASLEAINRRSRGLMQFVDRYRLVAEPPQLRLELVHGADIVKGIEKLLAADIAAAGVTSSFSVGSPALTFDADAALLEQALINMIRNSLDAVRFTATPRIDVRLSGVGGEACFKVIDNGCGIAPELREQIFVPFYSTKRAGSGIGLSLARNIALAHGGRISYQPNDPAGSIFELRLGCSNDSTSLDLAPKRAS
jgi:two-component system nitrogen regulation sensor histidine kinase NtrY